MAWVVTGCPHNDYTIELKPRGNVMERTLVFYCADGVNTNTGAPDYKTFDAVELAAITALYPASGLTRDGQRQVVRGEFTNTLPPDVGGTGAFTNLATSLGEAGFYAERFRGNDDPAGLTEKHFKAADQLADSIVGWSQAELGREPGYGQLHQFLNVNLRHDLKNLSLYWWEGQLVSSYKTNASEEFTIRFCQYLIERGYFTLGEIPNIFNNGSPDDPQPLLRRIQRLVADKMGVPETEPVPAALTFLADKTMLENSFSNYLAGTEAYRARLKEWENDKNPKPDAVPPNPTDMVGDAFRMLIDLDQFGDTPDHLAVRLALPRPPLQSNGRWDEALKQVAWDTDIEGRTNATRLPVFCYAIWGQANEEFQKAHFGKVALAGDNLTQYCLWRTDQDVRHGSEWDKFLEDLKPGPELMKRLDAFRFPGEPVQAVTNQPQNISIPSAYPRELLKNALP